MTNESHRIWYDTYIDAVIHYIRNYALADHAYMGNGSVPYFPSCSWRCRFFIYEISHGATCGNRYNPSCSQLLPVLRFKCKCQVSCAHKRKSKSRCCLGKYDQPGKSCLQELIGMMRPPNPVSLSEFIEKVDCCCVDSCRSSFDTVP